MSDTTGGKEIPWKPISDAPKSGITIIGNYGDGFCFIRWSSRPVCMGGPTVYIKPGWATGSGTATDSNLPMDPQKSWCYEEEFDALELVN